MPFESKLYFKEDASEHTCSNSVDETELLAGGWYFKTKAEAVKAGKPAKIDKPDKVVTKREDKPS